MITAEELQKKSYTDVIDAVKNMPGVSVQGGGNNKEITIRGMGATYTKYLINGRPVSAGRTVNGNGTDGGKIGAYLPPIDMIERIEVVRGPMSSLYGSDAMGGVINVITKKLHQGSGTVVFHLNIQSLIMMLPTTVTVLVCLSQVVNSRQIVFKY